MLGCCVMGSLWLERLLQLLSLSGTCKELRHSGQIDVRDILGYTYTFPYVIRTLHEFSAVGTGFDTLLDAPPMPCTRYTSAPCTQHRCRRLGMTLLVPRSII